MKLLKAILKQNATAAETEEFQDHVRKAKKQLKAEKEEREAKLKAEKATKLAQSLPLRSPSKFTPAEAETSAIPSTEHTDNSASTNTTYCERQVAVEESSPPPLGCKRKHV